MFLSIFLLVVLSFFPIPLIVKSIICALTILFLGWRFVIRVFKFRRGSWMLERLLSLILLVSMVIGVVNLVPYVDCSYREIKPVLVAAETLDSVDFASYYAYSVYTTDGDRVASANRPEDAQWLVDEYDADFEHYAYFVSCGLEVNSVGYSEWDNGNIFLPIIWKYYDVAIQDGKPIDNHTMYIYQIPRLCFELRPYGF